MKLAALVPVLNRPQNVAPLVGSWERCDAPGSLVFIVQRDDEAELAAIRETNVMHLIVDPAVTTWPQKINHAVHMLNADWYLFAADDVRFHPGWWQATTKARRDYRVIGTNDLGNPRVTSGEHATHPLVEGRYARLVPKVDGQPGPLHEGYHHWYVDDEFIHTAKARGVWTPCLEAVIEHLHPYFERGEWDETYALGESRSLSDRAEFERRVDMIRTLYEATGT
jgi:hypothetical protein